MKKVDVKQGEKKEVKEEMASQAPKVKPSMQHKEPQAQYQYPKNGEQSQVLDHKKKALPTQDAPAGVKGVNEGTEVALPKSGGVGESEV
jgi:hypothetical protein